MKQVSKDPFEAATFEEEQQESPPESPSPSPSHSSAAAAAAVAAVDDDDGVQDDTIVDVLDATANNNIIIIGDPPSSSSTLNTTTATATAAAPIIPPHPSFSASTSRGGGGGGGSHPSKNKEEEEEEEEENMDVELSKLPSSADPDKMAKMQAILSQFTEEQMSRYESFRRAGFQKANMKRLLASITGTQKISVPMTIVVSGIAKMFVGELVETARMVMTERKESGPIRPCHIREAYRRLKLEGKVPKRSVPRLFR
ncbi:transcription initiation factor TFIID subunit 11 [Quercus robur]|uniref:transcription initiation factor TFIID subunit 11 n=1 Tax=Quercus robur TaxID=38942 RepID=UPI002163CD38|nr:transcription initiation factor TFIID subunit 11 [Quercus robur]